MAGARQRQIEIEEARRRKEIADAETEAKRKEELRIAALEEEKRRIAVAEEARRKELAAAEAEARRKAEAAAAEAKRKEELQVAALEEEKRRKAEVEARRKVELAEQERRKQEVLQRQFDGMWEITRVGKNCFAPSYVFGVSIVNGTFDQGYGTISPLGEFKFLGRTLDTRRRELHYTGKFAGTSGAGTFYAEGGACAGTFKAKRRG